MCREILCLYVLAAICLELISSAPLASSSLNKAHAGKLSIYFNDIEAFEDPLRSTHRRSRRHVKEHQLTEEDRVIDEILSEDDDGSTTSRHRRSAVFMLHAALKLCREYNSFCGEIDLTLRDNIKITVKVADQ